MNRRNFLRLGLAGLAGAFIPKIGYELTERLGNDMQIGDILAKLGEGKPLSQIELQELRLWGNQTQNNNSYIVGLQNGKSGVIASSVNTNNLTIGKDVYSGYAAKIRRSSNYILPSLTFTTIPFESEFYDNGNFFDFNVSATNITIPKTGIYNTILYGSITSAATGSYLLATYRNGSTYTPAFRIRSEASQSFVLSSTDEAEYEKGEIVTVVGWQNSGSDATFLGGSLSIRLIRES